MSDLTNDEKFWLSAIALMTPLAGAALAGSQGALAGGAAGLGAVSKTLEARNKAAAEEKERAAKEALAKAELDSKIDDRLSQREFQQQEKAAQRQWQEEQNRLARENTRMLAESAAADRAERRTESNQLAREKAINADVEQFGKAFASQSDAKMAIKEIEDNLGFNLDDAKVQNGEIVVGGKVQDLPGVSIPLIGRVSGYSGDARKLAAAASKVFNVTLRDRSGAAVTTQELDRLRNEFNAGRFSSEADLIAGMQAYKRALMSAINNTRSSFSPEALAEFERRGGDLSTKTPAVPNPGKKFGESGTATASPAEKSVDEMDDSEVERQLKARGLL